MTTILQNSEIISNSIIGTFVRRLNSADSNYYVCICKTNQKEQIAQIPEILRQKCEKKSSCEFVVTGYELPVYSGVNIKFIGEWIENKYGVSFKACSYEVVTPETEEGIYQYLSCGRIKGIGPVKARAIVDKFGKDSLKVIDEMPEKLLSIPGIGEKKMAMIVKSYQTNAHLSEAISFLSQFGISVDRITALYDYYGLDIMNVLKSNPFSIMDVDGFGFNIADRIARSEGVMLDSDIRIDAALTQIFEEVKSQGHLYCEQFNLKRKAMLLLNEGFIKPVVTSSRFDECFSSLKNEKYVCRQNGIIFSTQTEKVERETALDIYRLNIFHPISSSQLMSYSKALLEWEANHPSVLLSEQQKEAILTSLGHRISVITGWPGTGKTTVCRAIVEIAQMVDDSMPITLLASTGRAASRLSEVTGLPASTIHRALGIYVQRSLLVSSNQLPENGLIIVDEMSMVDAFVANLLFRSVPLNSQIVLIGDADQLPSVGPGNVLREIIRSKEVPVVRLEQIFRQGPTSIIAENSARINRGETTLKSNKSFRFFPVDSEEYALEMILKLYQDEVKRVGIDNVVILCPMRRKGLISANELNKRIQSVINPKKAGSFSPMINGTEFRTGDRVMQTKNTDLYCNGDIGRIRKIELKSSDDGLQSLQFYIEFGNDTAVYDKDAMRNVDLAYALTVHKSQGAEYKSVIIPLMSKTPAVLLKRNLLYTAVSRAKESCTIIGAAAAVRKCIVTNDVDQRKTLLADRIHAHAHRPALKRRN